VTTPPAATLTDLYQLTMAAGYYAAGKQDEIATFELFVRQLPPGREYLIAAGLAQAVEYLTNLAFTDRELEYLAALPVLSRAAPGFFDYLKQLRFRGSVFAMPEGTVFFANQPVLTVRAPIIEAQLVETSLLAILSFQTMIATTASLVAAAAAGRPVIEFGTRRAHSPSAGLYAARASYIGGCAGTSNVQAGLEFGIPVYGTQAHSWILAFADETEAFARMRELLGSAAVQLIDTYDTLEGARRVAALGPPLSAVRIDSGDLAALSRQVRAILDEAGLRDVQIMLTGDLDAARIRELLARHTPVDSFGVGTQLATSADAPTLSAVYKLVQYEADGEVRYPAKRSPGKATVGGAKQVFRYAGYDAIARADECPPGSPRPLLEPVLLEGALLEPLPTAPRARDHAARQPKQTRPVVYSEELHANRIP
jgi:nicotinate phosphoribosyltransferase